MSYMQCRDLKRFPSLLSLFVCTLVRPHVRSSVSHSFVLFSFKYTHAHKTKQSNEEKFCLLLKLL